MLKCERCEPDWDKLSVKQERVEFIQGDRIEITADIPCKNCGHIGSIVLTTSSEDIEW